MTLIPVCSLSSHVYNVSATEGITLGHAAPARLTSNIRQWVYLFTCTFVKNVYLESLLPLMRIMG